MARRTSRNGGGLPPGNRQLTRNPRRGSVLGLRVGWPVRNTYPAGRVTHSLLYYHATFRLQRFVYGFRPIIERLEESVVTAVRLGVPQGLNSLHADLCRLG